MRSGFAAPMEPIKSTSPTILVVEDCAPIREIVGTVLRSRNFNVLEAATGPDALSVAADDTSTIDLVLSDIRLPGMSGIDVAQALSERQPPLPVILMSAFGEEYALGTWPFIRKPFTAQQLIDRIQEVLRAGNTKSNGTAPQ